MQLGSFIGNGEDISTVTNYKFLVVLVINDSYTNGKVKKIMRLIKPAMSNFTKHKTWQFQPTKILDTVDYSLCSSTVWVKRKANKRKTDETMDRKKELCISD